MTVKRDDTWAVECAAWMREESLSYYVTKFRALKLRLWADKLDELQKQIDQRNLPLKDKNETTPTA